LAAFRADPDRFDLVLTDELMPEMTGSELASALHEIRPDLPIILMTGHGGPVKSRAPRAAGIREVLKSRCCRPTSPRGSPDTSFCAGAATISNPSDFRCNQILAFWKPS
jgi:CheY-like chemotaxis protein